MPLTIGTRIAQYEIVAPIGAGGMGDVYRARDTKLNRDVALKLLPESFAQDPERVARFRREAQVLAALNHPHIAAIYGLEESAGTQCLVLELVEGETLQERLKAQGSGLGPSQGHKPSAMSREVSGGLPLGEALDIGNSTPIPEAGVLGLSSRFPRNFDIAPDGKRLLVVVDASSATPSSRQEIQVVLNWHEELKTRVPARALSHKP